MPDFERTSRCSLVYTGRRLISELDAMSISALNRLTVIGACLLYAGLLGGLILYGLPSMTGHGWQIVGYWILPATLSGGGLIGFESYAATSGVTR